MSTCYRGRKTADPPFCRSAFRSTRAGDARFSRCAMLLGGPAAFRRCNDLRRASSHENPHPCRLGRSSDARRRLARRSRHGVSVQPRECPSRPVCSGFRARVENCSFRSDCVFGSDTTSWRDTRRCGKLHPSEAASASHNQCRPPAPNTVASPRHPVSSATRRPHGPALLMRSCG